MLPNKKKVSTVSFVVVFARLWIVLSLLHDVQRMKHNNILSQQAQQCKRPFDAIPWIKHNPQLTLSAKHA